MSIVMILFLGLFCNCALIDAARILAFYSVPCLSHSKVFRSLTQALIKRGHQVTVITPDPEFAPGNVPPNLIEIDTHDLSYNIWLDMIPPVLQKHAYDAINIVFQTSNEIFMAQLKTNEVQKILNDKSEAYDVILVEGIVQMEVVLSYIYNAPLFQVSSFGTSYDNHNIIGSSDDALIYHHMFREKLFNLSFWQKVTEYYAHVTVMKNLVNSEIVLDEMLKKDFGDGVPCLKELRNNVDMLFLNVNPLWDIRPVPPGVTYMGGIHLKETEELPKDLKEYLDSSLNGVIYVSFGTNLQLSHLPSEKVRIFLKVFSQMPYTVLLKSNMDELEGRSENVKLSKWFPQADLLNHPNIKLLITHGGLQSIDETIKAGVPIIGIPIQSDQYLNVEQCVHYGAGVRLDLSLITEENFRSAIDRVITDKRYRLNVVRLRTWFADQRQTPVDRAVWWIEYVLRHGGARHLRSPAANMHWTEKAELSLVLFVFLSFLSVLAIVLFISYYLLKCLFNILNRYFNING